MFFHVGTEGLNYSLYSIYIYVFLTTLLLQIFFLFIPFKCDRTLWDSQEKNQETHIG